MQHPSTDDSAAPVTLTEGAARQVLKHLARRGRGQGVRIGVKPSGCTGLSWVLEFVDEAAPGDVRADSNGVAVYVSPDSLPIVSGTIVDFVREGLNEGFRFDNPKAHSHCGCGESFKV
jgi:iron-sulfur cluster assembly protein